MSYFDKYHWDIFFSVIFGFLIGAIIIGPYGTVFCAVIGFLIAIGTSKKFWTDNFEEFGGLVLGFVVSITFYMIGIILALGLLITSLMIIFSLLFFGIIGYVFKE